jgi:carboxyl-terminal processing protease
VKAAKLSTRSTIFRAAAAGILLGLVFAAGFFTRDMVETDTNRVVNAQSEDSGQLDFILLDEVHRLVADNYYAELPTDSDLEYGAIRGYLNSLDDPFSFFNEPPAARTESASLAGRYGGIGVIIKRNVAGEVELYPYPESPAVRAGIVDGDILVSVNGEVVDLEQNLDVIRGLLRGEVTDEGNGVTITIRTPDSEETRTLDIAFEEIRVPSVIWRMLPGEPQIGYLNVMSFTSRTPDELAEAIAALEDQGMQGLVLDLRNNAGGLLRESIEISEAFLDGGVIVIEESRVSGREVIEDTAGGIATEVPMMVLVNNRTASAAEVVAGALQQNDRAQLVGQQTRGKGSVQFIFGLSDGSSFRITGAVWLTPDETPLDGVGLDPDIPMIPDVNGREVELDEATRQLRQQLSAD